ncbi:hypothetical protein SAMN05661099_3226 [Daejeonella lutea]|uniref:Uncharacterized protein n=1 Tax=Daejeonella lutea TaxID=572036 RepID=A0A1T5EU55_9SPHI|nr:hypothetical protein SAMN05661099_3226 [Daejeonella lutea]
MVATGENKTKKHLTTELFFTAEGAKFCAEDAEFSCLRQVMDAKIKGDLQLV